MKKKIELKIFQFGSQFLEYKNLIKCKDNPHIFKALVLLLCARPINTFLCKIKNIVSTSAEKLFSESQRRTAAVSFRVSIS